MTKDKFEALLSDSVWNVEQLANSLEDLIEAERADAYHEGRSNGYDDGHDDGYADGWDVGFEAGVATLD